MRRTPFLLALTLTCCGLLPAPDPAPPFPSDGTTGFGEAEPIEVCLGSARVVPPDATGGSAVCVAEGAEGSACSADASCAGIERCVCGRCIVAVCDVGSECGEGRICRDRRCTTACAAPGDCPEGETCNAGGCARTCQGDGDCHFGERCDALGDTCVARLCSEATPCGAGRRCEPVTVAGELREPEVAVLGGASVAYVEMRGGAARAIYRARVDAAARWTLDPVDPVLAADAEGGAGAPALRLDGERVELYFALGEGAAIARAVSTDGGRTFARDAAPLLVPVPGWAWENGWIGSPSVVDFQGVTYLLYEGGPRAGIGLARLEGDHATRLFDAPIVSPQTVSDPLLWRGVTEVGAPSAVVAGDILRVYFTARGVEGGDALVGGVAVPAEANDSIGMAASLDARSFAGYPAGPVLARLTNLRTYLGEREAAVRLPAEGGAEITFVSADATGQSLTGLARAGR